MTPTRGLAWAAGLATACAAALAAPGAIEAFGSRGDPAGSGTRAVQRAQVVGVAALDALAADLRARAVILRDAASAERPAAFAAAVGAAPDGGGAGLAEIAGGDSRPMLVAWGGAALPEPGPLLAATRGAGDGPTLGLARDERQVWLCAVAWRETRVAVVGMPLGPVEPALAALSGAGALALAVGPEVTVQVGLPAGAAPTAGFVWPADRPLLAVALAPAPAEMRAARAEARARRAATLPLWLAFLCGALALVRGRDLWASARGRALAATLPLVGRALLAALGCPPAAAATPLLDPALGAGPALTLFRGAVPLGPLAACVATPLDTLLTALAVLAAVAIATAVPATIEPETRARRGTVCGGAIAAAVAARLLLEGLGGLVHAAAVAGLEPLPADRFLPGAAEAALAITVAALGLAIVRLLGVAGRDGTAWVAARLGPGVAAAGGAWGGIAAALVAPPGTVPGFGRLLVAAAVPAAATCARMPAGVRPAVLRILLAAGVGVVVAETTLDRTRDTIARDAVGAAGVLDALQPELLTAATRCAADPDLVAACAAVRSEPLRAIPDLVGQRLRTAPHAPLAATLFARHCAGGGLRRARLQLGVRLDADFAVYVPLAEFGLDTPAALRGLAWPNVESRKATRPEEEVDPTPPGATEPGTAEGIPTREVRVMVGPPGSPIGALRLVVPDPDAPAVTAEPPWLGAPRAARLAERLARAHFVDGVAVATSDPRLPRGWPLPATAVGLPLGAVTPVTDRVGEARWRFHALARPDGIRLVGAPALEPGPAVLRLARLALLAVLLGVGAWLAVAGTRRACGLPATTPWRWRFKYTLVATYLIVAVPPLVAVAVSARDILETALRRGLDAHQEDTLALVAQVMDTEVRLRIETQLFEAKLGLTEARVEGDRFDDEWCLLNARSLGHDLHIYGADGRLLHTSRRDAVHSGLLEPRCPGPVMRALLGDRASVVAHTRVLGGFPYRVAHTALRDTLGRLSGVLAIPMLAREREATLRVAETAALGSAIALAALLGAALLGAFLARRLASPMEALTAATRQVAAGDLDVRLPEGRRDELGDLVTAFNQMTSDLRESRARLVRAEKEAAWREMAQQIAHEVKNPLTPLKLAAQHLRRAYADKAPGFDQILADATDRIGEQVEALRKVASRFTAFAGKATREPRLLDVNAIVREAAGLFDTGAGVTYVTRCADTLPTVLADADDLRRVLINLIANARDAMGGTGTCTLRTVASATPTLPEKPRGDTRRLTPPAAAPAPAAGWVGIEVRDTGPGIPADVQARLFEPHFSTKSSGTGLGLWICRTTVADMGGEIALTSVAGEGTSALVWLPARQVPVEPAGPVPVVPPQPGARPS